MRQVSRTTLGALKNVKFRLSRNATKFVVVARFHETIQTVSPFHHPRSRKIMDFDRNYHFTNFHKIRIFLGFYNLICLDLPILT